MKLDSSLKVCGIYQIYNKVSDMSYVGSGKSIYHRLNFHFSALRGNRHSNEYLQNAFNKYGEEAFEVKILEVCTLDYLKSREEFHILNTLNRYNFIDKPTGPLRLPTPDAQRREIVRQKLTGRKRTEEQIKRFSESHIGLKQSEESNRKRSEALKIFYSDPENRKLQAEKIINSKDKSRETFLKNHPDGHRVEFVALICKQCKDEFKLRPGDVKMRQFCSKRCVYDVMKGKIPWNKDLRVKSNAN